MIVHVTTGALLEAIDALVLRANWYRTRDLAVPEHVDKSLHELCALVGYDVISDGKYWRATPA